MTTTNETTGRSHLRRKGEDDDVGVIVRDKAGQLNGELKAKGGLEPLLNRLRIREDSRYRAAMDTAARDLLAYSGRGYPEAGIDGYGEPRDVAGVTEADYELARKVLDELALIRAAVAAGEVLEAALDAGVLRSPPAGVELDLEAAVEDTARELVKRRRAARAGG